MASHRVHPQFLANVSRRFATPVAASLAAGLILIALTWIYLLTASVQNVFNQALHAHCERRTTAAAAAAPILLLWGCGAGTSGGGASGWRLG